MKLTALFLTIFIWKLSQLILVIVNPYNFYSLDGSVLTFLVIEIFLIPFFAIASYRLKKISVYKSEPRSSLKYLKKFYIMPAVLFFTTMFYLKITLNVSFQELRDLFFFGTDFLVSFSSLNYLFFIYTALGYLLLFSGIIFKDREAVYIALTAMFLFDVAQGGRMFLFYALFLLFSAYFTFKESSNLFKFKRNKIIYLILAFYFVIAFVSLITFSRISDGNTSFAEFLYVYFIGPVYLFSEAVKASDFAIAVDGRFGISFMSLDWAITGVIKLFSSEFETLNTLADPILSSGYYFSDKYGMNAAFTSNFYLFNEYSYLGTIFFPVLLIGLSRLKIPFTRFLIFLLVFSYFISVREHFLNSPIFLIALLAYPFFIRRVKYV